MRSSISGRTIQGHPEFPSEQAFADQRNRFGGLLLLPKDFNASYGDKPYADKLQHYFGQNLLAKSLHPKCYEHNPTFLRLRDERDLPFVPIPEDFTVDSFATRQVLYQRLCELIWDPSNFGIDVTNAPERPVAPEKPQRFYGVSLKDLLDAGMLVPGQALVGTRNGVTCSATVMTDGQIELEDGRREESPSTAGAAALATKACNGWYFWQADTSRGLLRLTRIRDDYLERRR